MDPATLLHLFETIVNGFQPSSARPTSVQGSEYNSAFAITQRFRSMCQFMNCIQTWNYEEKELVSLFFALSNTCICFNLGIFRNSGIFFTFQIINQGRKRSVFKRNLFKNGTLHFEQCSEASYILSVSNRELQEYSKILLTKSIQNRKFRRCSNFIII